MDTKENYKVIDNYQIEFYDNDVEQEFYYYVQKLEQDGAMKIRTLLLPAPLDVLINEYDSRFLVEYRDVMGPLQGADKSMKIFKEYTKILNNSASDAKELYITDRYLFCSNEISYLNIIIEILNDINIKEIKFIVPEEFSGFNLKSFEFVKQELLKKEINIDTLHSDKFHDRFWISDVSGFVSGTSLKGIARRTSLIQRLDPLDYLAIYREIKKI